jgi:hypothetical protein
MIAVAHSPARLVSPLQAALGAFFGGPMGFAFFSRANCVAVGDRVGAKRMLALSVGVFLVWHAAIALALYMAAAVVLNLLFGGTPFVLMAAAYRVAEQQVASAPGHAVFRSGWSVFGITALCFAASAACAFAAIAAAIVALLATSGFR